MKRKLNVIGSFPLVQVVVQMIGSANIIARLASRVPKRVIFVQVYNCTGYIQEMEIKCQSLQEELRSALMQIDQLRNTLQTIPLQIRLPDSVNDDGTPQLRLIHLFFEYGYPCMPIFHPYSFLETYKTQEKSLLYIMAAIGLRYFNAIQFHEPDHSEADRYYEMAKSKIDNLYETPRLVTLQTLLLLMSYSGSKLLSHYTHL